jgi:hypothetical protein
MWTLLSWIMFDRMDEEWESVSFMQKLDIMNDSIE